MGLLEALFVCTFLIATLHIRQSFQQAQFPAAYNEDPNIVYPFVKSPAGQFRGQALSTRDGKWYYEFRGIPFAETPLRFEPSVLKAPMAGTYEARNHKSVCPQPEGLTGVQGSEDCLFLSVAYPHEDQCQNETNTAGLPVMVHIHGGAFSSGAGSSFEGKYLLDKCVVLVSINYRLGALGFLATEDGIIPGNLGLKDQVVALKWVQTNIDSFRGDPGAVTLFGISAGGSSISHLMASPAAKGLFHRAICQSGGALNVWGVTTYPDKNAQRLAQALNCSTASSSEMKECLRSKSIEDIVSNTNEATIGGIVQFAPIIENSAAEDPFQTQHPGKVFQSGDFSRVPMIAGFVRDEGIFMRAETYLGDPAIVLALNNSWNSVAPSLFYYDHWNISAEERDNVSAKIRNFYFSDKPVGESTRLNLTNLCSDRYFVQSIFYNVELISKFATVYPYVMSYRGGLSLARTSGYLVPAISHGDDAQYLSSSFVLPVTEYPYGTEQNEFSRKIVSLWTSFATTGEPVGEEPSVGSWEAAEPGKSNSRWFDLNFPSKTIPNYLEERKQFWDTLGSHYYDIYY